MICTWRSCGLRSNEVKCVTSRYIGHVIVHAHVRTEVIILFPVTAHPLHSLTAKLDVYIVESIHERLSGRFIWRLAFLSVNPVQGVNQICHWDIPRELGKSPERKSWVPVSVRSSHVAKLILPSSSDHDILAKYSHEKLDTFELITVLRLFCMPSVSKDCFIVL